MLGASKQLQQPSTPLPHSTHHPAGDLGALPEAGQLAPALSGVSVPNPGTPPPPGNVGLGGRVAGLGGLLCSPKRCFWGRDGDKTLPHHGSPIWGSPHALLPGVLDGQWDAPSRLCTFLAAFPFPRASRANQGEPAQPHSLAEDPLGITGDLGSPWLGGQEEQERAVLGRAMGALTA